MNQTTVSFLALSLFVIAFLFSSLAVSHESESSAVSLLPPTALADDDEEDEDEEEDKDDDEDEDTKTSSTSSSSTTTSKKVIQETIEYKPVVETVIVTDEDYQKDTDGDLLVDAIDPDPLVNQNEYFTDTDGDSVPDAIDKHHDEDDFAFYEDETDTNSNGILDSYEALFALESE